MLVDSAAMIELPANMATAARRVGLRPNMSETLAQMGAAAAFASRYAPPIQLYPLAEWSSLAMVGMDVAMMV